MNFIDTCERYINYMRKSGYDEKDLESCIRFHLFEEVRKRAKFDKRYLKLIKLVKDSDSINCLRGYEKSNLCEYQDIFLSYARVVLSKFEKESFKVEEIFKSICIGFGRL